MYRKIICLVLCFLLLGVTACTAPAAPSAEPSETPAATPSASQTEETEAPSAEPDPSGEPLDMSSVSDLLLQTESFSIMMLQNLKTAYTDQNTLFSPLAFNGSMAALYAAAGGDTEEEIRVLMGYTTEPEDTVSALSTLYSSVNSDHFILGNSLHLSKRVQFSEKYLNDVTAPLRIGTYSQDYADAATAAAINACAEVFLSGAVSEVLPSTSAADTLYLLSSFNINGAFDFPFDEAATVPGTFEAPTGLVSAPMMHGDFVLNYAEDEYMQMVSLPMEEGDLSLRLILPRADSGEAFDEAMIQYADSWLAPETAAPQDISLNLPRFTLESNTSYLELLSTMGLHTALRAQTVNLTEMLDASLILPTPVNDIFSVASLSIGEGGVNIRQEDAGQPIPAEPSEEGIELTFDRPFLVAVTDTQTGALLAMGWVNTVSTGR